MLLLSYLFLITYDWQRDCIMKVRKIAHKNRNDEERVDVEDHEGLERRGGL